jgi:hypothetical protein
LPADFWIPPSSRLGLLCVELTRWYILAGECRKDKKRGRVLIPIKSFWSFSIPPLVNLLFTKFDISSKPSSDISLL